MASSLTAKVGKGVLAGLGYVVTKDIPPLAIAGENPAEVIRYRNKEEYETLNRKNSTEA